MNIIEPKALTGAVIGSAVPLICLMKSKNVKNPLKLDYKIQDILFLSSSSIIGGSAIGMINEPKEKKQKKIKEGVFQLFNTSLPAIFSYLGVKACENIKCLDKVLPKMAALVSGIALGIFGAQKISNKILDPKDIYPDRKVTPKDCISNIDDVIGALALAKIPFVKNLNIDKVLPVVYSYCGYRAGKEG